MADEFELEVEGSEQLSRAVAALADVGKYIPLDIKDKINDAAVDLAEKAARRVQAVKMQKPGYEVSTGLRRRIARGIGVKRLKAGDYTVHRVTTSMLDSDEAIIPRGFDSPAKGFRHPVFGNKNKWVRQLPANGWFRDTMDDSARIIPPKLEDILEFSAEWIDHNT